MSKRKVDGVDGGTGRDDRDACLIVPVEEFWERKVDWFTQCWWNERHTDDQYIYNMKHMGFEEDLIRNNMYEES